MSGLPNEAAGAYAPLSELLWPAEKPGRPVRAAFMTVLGSLVLTASAHINIPLYPVPMTLQTLAVLLIGAVYGWRLGMATVFFYLLLGAASFPVFAGTPEKGLGLAYMTGPTGGYIFGFLLAAGVVGWFAERGFDRSFLLMFSVMVLGTVIIYVPGVLWLGTYIGWDKRILDLGLFPFVYGDSLKILLGTILLPLIWRLLPAKTGAG